MPSKVWAAIRRFFRATWLYLLLAITAVVLFYLAFNLSSANLWAIMAAGVVFGCLVALFVLRRSSIVNR